MDTLRTWAAWTVGWMAEKAEDVADALNMVADFLEYDGSGIEAVRDSFLYDATVVGWRMLGSNDPEARAAEDEMVRGVLVSNEEPATNPGFTVNGIGWPMPGDDYEPGNGHWYATDGETGPMEGADS